ncbi:MAG: OmpA family protein [Flavobacteriaceae bacterium]
MKVRIKKFLGLLLVWISFGFALNQYLGQDLLPVDVEQDNYRLALKWAGQVGAYFTANGLSANRLEIKSLGEEQPLFTNKTMRGRQKNRRVELIFKY